jgi:murein DD-endopeptidase MepM/ murein hydrolase activator NlpD
MSGDSLKAVASRFGLHPDEISSPSPLPQDELLAPGQLLLLPPRVEEMRANHELIKFHQFMPDSEVVYGPSAADFDVSQYLVKTDGYLAEHREYLGSTSWTPAADVVTRIALENSINPRLLLALMEYECSCVLGDSPGKLGEGYVLGVEQYEHQWLYGQLGWAANELSKGYYGWRSGSLTEIRLPNGIILRPAPESNAGSVALLYYFTSLATQKSIQKIPTMQRPLMDSIPVDDSWRTALDKQDGFLNLYQRMFGDRISRSEMVEPLFPDGLQAPELQLPFEAGFVWSYTSGPHKAWQTEGALAALDFAPSSKRSGCELSYAWVVAAADGIVTRTGDGFVIQDLDGSRNSGDDPASDENEFTGWALLYMHIRDEEKVPEGAYLKAGDPIGHPSCQGGPATGTHLHFARKYNGEWIAADGPLPLILSGWRVHAGEAPYEGTLTKDEQTVVAHPWGSYDTLVWIPADGSPPIPTQLTPSHAPRDNGEPKDKFD